MKSFIYFLLLIAICVTIYVVADDHIRLRDQTLQQTSTTFKVAHSVTSNPKHSQTSSILGNFEANGTEPFWAAQFSGLTLHWQNPDQGSLTINGFTGPIVSGVNYIWVEPANIATIIITSGSCNNGMSDVVFPGSISLVLSGQTWNGCIS